MANGGATSQNSTTLPALGGYTRPDGVSVTTGGSTGSIGGAPITTMGPNATPSSTQPNIYNRAAGAYNNSIYGLSALAGVPEEPTSYGSGTYKPNSRYGRVSLDGTRTGPSARSDTDFFGGSFQARTEAARNDPRGGEFGMWDIAQADPTTLRDIDLSAYRNPYQQQVIDASMRDAARTREMLMNRLGDEATAAGAFGGNRHGVAMGTTQARLADDLLNRTANLRYQGWNAANALGQQEANTRNQFALTNAGALNAGNQAYNQMLTQRYGADQSRKAAIAAARMRMQASLANTQLGAARALGQMSQQGLNMGNQINQGLLGTGGMQQDLANSVIGGANQNFGQYANWPMSSAGGVTGVMGALPGMGGTTTETSNPGLLGTIAGISSLFGG